MWKRKEGKKEWQHETCDLEANVPFFFSTLWEQFFFYNSRSFASVVKLKNNSLFRRQRKPKVTAPLPALERSRSHLGAEMAHWSAPWVYLSLALPVQRVLVWACATHSHPPKSWALSLHTRKSAPGDWCSPTHSRVTQSSPELVCFSLHFDFSYCWNLMNFVWTETLVLSHSQFFREWLLH